MGGKHAGGSPRRRGTFRDSFLIGAATSSSAAGAAGGDTPARGCRRASVQNGPRAALTTTIAAGVVAVATGSVAYTTTLQPLAGTASAPVHAPEAQAGAPTPGPSSDRGASGPIRHSPPDTARPTTEGESPDGGRSAQPLPARPGSGALPVAPPAAAGAPFEFTNPLLPAVPLPGISPPYAGEVPGPGVDDGRPAEFGRAADEAVVAAPAATAENDDLAHTVPVIIKSDDSGLPAASAEGAAVDEPVVDEPAAPPLAQAPADRPAPSRDRMGDPHHRSPISVADWFARLTFRDPPPDPFTADPHQAKPAAPADRPADDAKEQAAPGSHAEAAAKPAPAQDRPAKDKPAKDKPAEQKPAAPATAAPAEKKAAPDEPAKSEPAEDVAAKDAAKDEPSASRPAHAPQHDAAPQSRDWFESGRPENTSSRDDAGRATDTRQHDDRAVAAPGDSRWTSTSWFGKGGGSGSHR